MSRRARIIFPRENLLSLRPSASETLSSTYNFAVILKSEKSVPSQNFVVVGGKEKGQENRLERDLRAPTGKMGHDKRNNHSEGNTDETSQRREDGRLKQKLRQNGAPGGADGTGGPGGAGWSGPGQHTMPGERFAVHGRPASVDDGPFGIGEVADRGPIERGPAPVPEPRARELRELERQRAWTYQATRALNDLRADAVDEMTTAGGKCLKDYRTLAGAVKGILDSPAPGTASSVDGDAVGPFGATVVQKIHGKSLAALPDSSSINSWRRPV